RLRAGPSIEGQGERAAHAFVVERLLLLVESDLDRAVPRAFLHGDLASERAHDLIALDRREAAELRHRALAADGRHLRRRIADEQNAIAVEIRLALVPVVR